MKRYLSILVAAFIVGLYAIIPSWCANTDIWNQSGQGIYWGKDMAHIDSSYNLRLYNGSLVLGDNGLTPTTANTQVTPSISVGGYYGVKIPITNGSAAASASGMVVVSSVSNTSAVQGSFANITATTSILGIVDGTYSSGQAMYMTVSGYAAVLTTGTVKIGDLLVSSAPASGALGRAGAATGTVVVGTVIGKALTAGVASGDTVLALISPQ